MQLKLDFKQLADFSDDFQGSISAPNSKTGPYDFNILSNILSDAESLIRGLLSIPADYEVLLLDLKSSGSFNFATIYENGQNIKGAYLDSGTRSSHSISMGRNVFDVEVIGSSRESNYSYIPDSIWMPCDISFFHLTSSNEAEGNQQTTFPIVGVPYICDMSSDLFSREINIQAFDLIYANGGYNFLLPGICILIARKKFHRLRSLEKVLSKMLIYGQSKLRNETMEKLRLLTQHLNYAKTIGGMSTIAHLCAKKAIMIYREIDRNKVFLASVNPAHRSKLAFRFYLIAQVEPSSFSQFLFEQGISGIQLMKDSSFILYLNISTTIDMVDYLVSRLQDFEEICIPVLKR